MTIRSTYRHRVLSALGLACLAMSMLLLPAGVHSVRAEDDTEQLMSVDPALVAGARAISKRPPVAPVIRAGDEGESLRPGRAGTEVQAGVIVLNTRGYNYGAKPSDLDPAALGQESEKP